MSFAGYFDGDSQGAAGDTAVISGAAAATGQWWLPLASEGIKAAGAALGGSGPAGPSRSDSGGVFGFDNSGWVVNTGSGSASYTPANSWIPMALAAVAGLVIWKILKKS